MRFGRVLVATTLVVVLASSLFSGWLLASEAPVVHAAGDVFYEYQDKSYRGVRLDQNTIVLSATFTAKEDALGHGNDPLGMVDVTLTLSPDSSKPSGASEPWKITKVEPSNYSYDLSDGTEYKRGYGDLTNFSIGAYFTKFNSSGVGSLYAGYNTGSLHKIGSGENTTPISAFGSVPLGAYGSNIMVGSFGLVVPTGNLVVDNYTLTNSSGSPGINTVKAWFDDDFNLDIKFFNDKPNQPPKVFLEKNFKFPDRPHITFKLSAFSGEGSGLPFFPTLPTALATLFSSVHNQEWYTFETYDSGTGKKIDKFYLLVNDDQESYFYYDAGDDKAGINKGKFGETIGDPKVSAASIDKLVSYVMNYPEDKSDNCVDAKSRGIIIKTTGPVGKNITPEANQNSLLEPPASLSGEQARGMNQNCSNIDNNGWLEYWGVDNRQSADPLGSKGCTVNGLDLVSSGLGQVVAKMIGCIVQYVVTSVEKPLNNYLCATAKLSKAPPGVIGRARAQGDPTTELGKDEKCGSGKVGNTGSFEDELKERDSVVRRIWDVSMGFVNIVVVLALLAIAFANILHLNINTYTAKKALPALVIGVVGANASLLIIRFLADVTNAVAILAVDIGQHGGSLIQLIAQDFPGAIGRALIAPLTLSLLLGPLALIIGIILIIYYFYLVCIFIFTFVKRLVFLYFLTAVAPLAFVAYGVPNFQQYFTKWWELLLRFLFLYPIVLLGMALTVKLADAVGTPTMANIFTVPTLFGIALVLAAASLVLKLPKMITKGMLDVGEAAKKAWGLARQAPVSGATYMGNRRATQAKAIKDKFGANSAEYIAANKRARGWATWRARANIAGNPQMLKEWYDARTKREADNTKIDTVSSKGQKVLRGSALNWLKWKGQPLYDSDKPTPELLKGRRASFAEKEAGAIDRFNKAASQLPDDPVAGAKGMRQFGNRAQMLRAVKAGVGVAPENAESMTPEGLDFFRQVLLAASGDIQMERLEGMMPPDPGGEDIGVEAYATVAAYLSKIARDIRRKNRKLKESEVLQQTYQVAFQGFESWDEKENPDKAKPGEKPYSSPSDDDLPTTGFYDPSGNPYGGGGAATFGGSGFDQAAFNSHLDRVVQHLDNLKVGIGDAELSKLASLVPHANTPENMDVGAMTEALKAVTKEGFHGKIDATATAAAQDPKSLEELADMVRDMATAGGNSATSGRTRNDISQRLENRYATSAMIDDHSKDIASRLDEEKLSEIISGSFEEALTKANEVMGGNIAKINEAITQSGQAAKDQTAVLQRVVSELQGMRNNISGKGPNSLASIQKRMGPMIAKAMEVGHMSTLQAIKETAATTQAKAVEATQAAAGSSEPAPQPAPATPTENPASQTTPNTSQIPPATPDDQTKQ